VLLDAMNRLSVVLGAQFYLRGGETAIFQKLLRDLQPVGFGHAARAACQTTVLPQLPMLARRSWRSRPEPPVDLFRLDAELPPLPFDRLAVTAAGRDDIATAITTAPAGLPAGQPRLLAERFAGELRRLAADCAALPATGLGVGASPEAAELASRYGVVLAAAACAGIWEHHGGRDPFLADPAWLVAALTRLGADVRVGPPNLPAHLEEQLFGELCDRYAGARGFDLAGRPLPDGGSARAA
jgi:hypothetical protein